MNIFCLISRFFLIVNTLAFCAHDSALPSWDSCICCISLHPLRQWLPYAAFAWVQTECAWTYKTRYLDKGLWGWLLVLRVAGVGVMHRCGREWRRCLNAPWPQTVWRFLLLSKLCWLVNRMLCRVSLSLWIEPLCTVRWLLPVFSPHLCLPRFLQGPHFCKSK